MKVEMGESLFYSWLRHIKHCQIVQTNWKPSTQWMPKNEAILSQLMQLSAIRFHQEYGREVFKKTNSYMQLVKQAEIDALGIALQHDPMRVYAVDVAFHEGGLLYGKNHQETAMKVTMKYLRTAMCLHGYFDAVEGDLIFASPKVGSALFEVISGCMHSVESLLHQCGLNFNVRIIANKDFGLEVLKPILEVSKSVADTSELFLRSYQLCSMFPESSQFSQSSPRKVDSAL